jgi:hypothetical protein
MDSESDLILIDIATNKSISKSSTTITEKTVMC